MISTECFEVMHPKKLYVIHVCTDGNESVTRLRVFVGLWTQYDGNLHDGIKVPNGETVYEAPKFILKNSDILQQLQMDLMDCATTDDVVRVAIKYDLS